MQFSKDETAYLIRRITEYNDVPSRDDLLKSLEAIRTDLDETECEEEHVDEYTHDECYGANQVDDLISEAVEEKTKELQAALDRLSKQKSRQSKQTLLNRIDDLEGELSDVRADYNVLKSHIEKSVVAAKLAEDFIFTPEEARAQFRVIAGGAA